MIVPDDLAAAFDTVPGSREQYESFTPGQRKQVLRWLVDAKRPATREKRITEAVRLAAEGVPANNR
ncbi:YdeI/OmpD-associated family protein [Mumia sp. Pv 4-285]|uniref:YdeI/OmpD-associated family protein n=1 Tax=Mumia qirimensis TaxID=3234852 RepID=UPI00351D3FD2